MPDELTCPRCEGLKLECQEINGIRIDTCGKCGGVWLHKGELDAITHPHDGDIEYCSTDAADIDSISDACCPKCKGTKMVKVNFISFSDIVLEHCRKCQGLWLDRGELDAINAEIDKMQKAPEHWEHKIMVFLSKLPF